MPVSTIPEAALELLVTQGFDATSVEELAAAAGISRSTFFRRFGTKEDMVFADQDAVLARVGEALASGHTTPAEAVVAAALAVFDHHTARPHASRLRYELLQKVSALRDRELVSTHRYERMFRRWLSTADASGTVPDASGTPPDAAGTAPEAADTVRDATGDAGRIQTRDGNTAHGTPTVAGTTAGPNVGPDAAAVAFAAGVVAVHNAFLRQWLRSPASTVRAALEAELRALGRLFAPYLEPRTTDTTGVAGVEGPGVRAAGAASADSADSADRARTEARPAGRVVVAVADASSGTESVLAAVREALERRERQA